MTSANNTKLNNQHISQALRLFFISTYLVLLFLVASTIDFHLIFAENKTSFVFLCAAFVLYGLLYLMPALLLTKITKKLLFSQLAKPYAQSAVYTVAVFSTAVTTLLFYANAKLYSLYGMYINGFVLNLVITPGGIQSLGGSSASDVGFAAIALGFLVLQMALLWLAIQFSKKSALLSHALLGWKSAIFALLMVVTVHIYYAYD